MKIILIILIVLSTNIINALNQEQNALAGKPLTYAKILDLTNNTNTKSEVFNRIGAPNIIIRGTEYTTWIYIFYDFSRFKQKMINRSISITFSNITSFEKIKIEIFNKYFKKDIKNIFQNHFIQSMYSEKPPILSNEYYDIMSMIVKITCSFVDIKLNKINNENNYQ